MLILETWRYMCISDARKGHKPTIPSIFHFWNLKVYLSSNHNLLQAVSLFFLICLHDTCPLIPKLWWQILETCVFSEFSCSGHKQVYTPRGYLKNVYKLLNLRVHNIWIVNNLMFQFMDKIFCVPLQSTCKILSPYAERYVFYTEIVFQELLDLKNCITIFEMDLKFSVIGIQPKANIADIVAEGSGGWMWHSLTPLVSSCLFMYGTLLLLMLKNQTLLLLGNKKSHHFVFQLIMKSWQLNFWIFF